MKNNIVKFNAIRASLFGPIASPFLSRGTNTNWIYPLIPNIQLRNQSNYQFYEPPPFQRSDKLNIPTSTDLKQIKEYLSDPENQYFDGFADIEPYCTDWTGVFQSATLKESKVSEVQKPVVIFPQTVQEISAILKYCNEKKIPVNPQAGNTGLVWGSVPVYDEIIINVSKMNNILGFNKYTGALKCEAGCIVDNLNTFLSTQSPKFMLPYDLGSKGSCQIGGNISTNAGGLRMVRYGNLAGSILGLEIVLADGTIIDATSELKKDNTGMKLHQLFIGAEGTLGIVTKVVIQCPISPSSVQTCLLKFNSFEKLTQIASEFKIKLSDIIAAIEFFDHTALNSVLKVIPNTKDAFSRSNSSVMEDKLTNSKPSEDQFYLLIETHGQDEASDKARLSQMVESLLEEGMIEDGVWAESETQRKDLWVLREQISTSLNYHGKVHKFDLTFKPGNMYAVIEQARNILGGFQAHDLFAVGYGHVGDGNIHLNVIVKNPDPEMFKSVGEVLNNWVYNYTIENGGSISAEHGIGMLKVKKLQLAKSSSYISTMKKMKMFFDPSGILNPYKLV